MAAAEVIALDRQHLELQLFGFEATRPLQFLSCSTRIGQTGRHTSLGLQMRTTGNTNKVL